MGCFLCFFPLFSFLCVLCVGVISPQSRAKSSPIYDGVVGTSLPYMDGCVFPFFFGLNYCDGDGVDGKKKEN